MSDALPLSSHANQNETASIFRPIMFGLSADKHHVANNYLEQLVAHAADSVVLRHGKVCQQVAVSDVRRDRVPVLVCCPFAKAAEKMDG